ncbi:hypothetical protein KCV07_g4737, partial [Aureobasidium melanogenum]
MDDPALLADTNAVASSSPTRATLSTLPVEMLDRILQLVDNSDLINLRYVSKYICAVANRPFAFRNFRTRRHVVTEHSLKALLAISAHETFGAYFKDIIFSPARALRAVLESDDSENDGIVVDDSFVQSSRFSDLMQQVLFNLKQHSDSIAIGVHEGYCLGHGCHDQYFMASKRQLFHGERAFCEAAELGTVFETPETLELIFTEMHAAAINIDGLSIIFARHSCYEARCRTRKAIEKFFSSHNASIDLHLQWDSDGNLEYKHLQSCLRFSGSSLLFDRRYFRDDVLLLDYAVQQLADKSLSELNLRDLHVGYLASLDMYFAQSLRTVILDDINLGSIFFAENLYSNMFERLSELRDLRYCKLHRLHYILQQENEMSPHVMRTKNGTYRSQWESLLLIFPDGKFEFEIQGADVSQKLRDLAAYTAAAERGKVRKTDTDREVVDYRVIGAGVPILEQQDPEYSSSALVTY